MVPPFAEARNLARASMSCNRRTLPAAPVTMSSSIPSRVVRAAPLTHAKLRGMICGTSDWISSLVSRSASMTMSGLVAGAESSLRGTGIVMATAVSIACIGRVPAASAKAPVSAGNGRLSEQNTRERAALPRGLHRRHRGAPGRRHRGGRDGVTRVAGPPMVKTDVATSRRMAGIRQCGTAPELLVRAALRALGLHYRISNRDLPGSPDIANRRHRWAIFVHGCFWLRHGGCKRTTSPKRNAAFWSQKFEANVARDARAMAALDAMGFKVAVVWECEALLPTTRLARVLRGRLRQKH